jgi:Protein of unknown function (DUF2934)
VLVRVHAPAIHTNGHLGCHLRSNQPTRLQAASPEELWRESSTFTRFRLGAALQPKVQLCVVRKSRVSAAPVTRTSKMENADLQQRIKLRAYLIWEQEGRPEGRAEEHWLRAEAEVAGISSADAGPGTPGAGEQICPACEGTGRIGRHA